MLFSESEFLCWLLNRNVARQGAEEIVELPQSLRKVEPDSTSCIASGDKNAARPLSYTILLEEVLGEKKCRQKHGGFRPLLTPD